MPEMTPRRSELWKGARRGAGWAVGFGAVLGATSVLRNGPHLATKDAMKKALALRAASAELIEQARDVYSEAEAEYAADAVVRTDAA